MVIDASAAIEGLPKSTAGERLLDRLEDEEAAHAPHLIDVKIARVLRRHVLANTLSAGRAAAFLTLWRQLDIERHSHEHLLERIWGLRPNLTAYDATYVALAEVLDQPLITADRRLAAAPGINVPVEVL
jgi:predicted nucleic acid-binding protein